MICEKGIAGFTQPRIVNMADNRSVGGNSQHSDGSISHTHRVRGTIRSNQTLVSAQEMFYEVRTPDQVSLRTITQEGNDERVGRGGFPETVVMAINPDASFTLSMGI